MQENDSKPLDADKILGVIDEYVPLSFRFGPILNESIRFVHLDDDEYETIKKARRPGRGSSPREDVLKMKIQALQKEQQNGFCEFRPWCPPRPTIQANCVTRSPRSLDAGQC